jgi:two-component system, OmpR family, phosphate regulon response regulator OmpR
MNTETSVPVAPTAGRLVVLDDDPDLRAMLQRYLSQHDYEVRCVSDRTQLTRLLQREPFDVLILDLMLPGDSGLAVCQDLRAQGEHIPILMLTARGDPVDRVVGLEMGADDYLPKPFSPRELLARIHALIRRQSMVARPHAGHVRSETVAFGRFVLNMSLRKLFREGAEVALTTGELELLAVLVASRGRPLGRERLIEVTRRRNPDAQGRTIDVQILRLRRAIEADPTQPRYIQTVWGVGYVFVPDPQVNSSKP